LEKLPFGVLRRLVDEFRPSQAEWIEVPSQFDALCDLVREVAPTLLLECPADWLEELVELVCKRYGLDELDGQIDLFSEWDGLFAAAVKKFSSELTVYDRFQLGRLEKPSQCLNWLGAKLRAPKVAVVMPAPEVLRDVVPVSPAKAASVKRERIASAAPVAQARRFTAFELLRALPAWAELLPASRLVFTVMYRRADRSRNVAQPWCQVSVGLLEKATGYKSRQVENALAELRRGRWIGYVVRGRPMIGGSRYWVVTSPAQLGVKLSAKVLTEIAFKP
jgi:hypothetical protein